MKIRLTLAAALLAASIAHAQLASGPAITVFNGGPLTSGLGVTQTIAKSGTSPSGQTDVYARSTLTGAPSGNAGTSATTAVNAFGSILNYTDQMDTTSGTNPPMGVSGGLAVFDTMTASTKGGRVVVAPFLNGLTDLDAGVTSRYYVGMQPYVLVADESLDRAATTITTCAATAGSATLTGCGAGNGTTVGQIIVGTGIDPGTMVYSGAGTATIVMSKPATATGTPSLGFYSTFGQWYGLGANIQVPVSARYVQSVFGSEMDIDNYSVSTRGRGGLLLQFAAGTAPIYQGRASDFGLSIAGNQINTYTCATTVGSTTLTCTSNLASGLTGVQINAPGIPEGTTLASYSGTPGSTPTVIMSAAATVAYASESVGIGAEGPVCALCIGNGIGFPAVGDGATNGTILGVWNNGQPIPGLTAGYRLTVLNGIDLSILNFTGYAWKSPGATIDGAGNLSANNVTAGGPVKFQNIAAAGLPTCNSAAKGQFVTVTDLASAPAFRAAITTTSGGGSAVNPVMCDGTNWLAI